MFIKKGNFVIRNATIEDALILCEWWNDGKIMAHAGFPNGLGTTIEKIASHLIKESDETHRCLIIEYNSAPIGEMSYRNLGNQVVEIGIKICDSSKQGKGFGKVLLSMLIHTLFEKFNYIKVVLDTNIINTRAQHVYELLGFQKLKINVNAWKDQLGHQQTSVDYELVKKDFKPFDLDSIK